MPPEAVADVVFLTWTHASRERRAHITRVVSLLARWAAAMRISKTEADAWTSAGILHDALRDAPEPLLRELSGDSVREAELLHGPAAAKRAEQDGERRADVLDAARYHTVGHAGWARTGRALYMADWLEPGRTFLKRERAALARRVPKDFDAAFRDVVRLRVQRNLDLGGEIFPETAALWNAVR